MSISRSLPNIARYATTSAAPKPKVLVVGAGTSPYFACHIRADQSRIGWIGSRSSDLQCLQSTGTGFEPRGCIYRRCKLSHPDSTGIADHKANANHDYQPGWTVVGSGLADKKEFRRPLESLIPSHIGHIQAQASGYEPGTNQVVLNDGSKVSYDYLVVAPGLKLSKSSCRTLLGPIWRT